MTQASITTITTQIGAVISGFVVLWVLGAIAVAGYGRNRGYPWLPLFFCGLFLYWPIVLLAIVIGVGPKRPQPPSVSQTDLESQRLINLARVTER